ncbi:Stk1 family PASTA domain-containing Ser/Thr kinase [Frigoribacterium sp. PvP032]|uniref:Stk1 family PASTA domain-containing Ser/Thr kinase n=1 Tax=Frigoribacterium sp. PvP032 TaxID=2806589 RepID=UPI001B418D96|nr:Stk1 family PASTA domain-containing Ser/Thr kinase [Frigoribacterium sp. PvP032]MBP1189160.1 serine/threonine-protein kinase [Frigoribacterium sp. PvP032]
MAEGVREGIHLLANRYQIGELIGRGGMADVHVGTDARLGRRVAIKLMKPSLATDPAFRTRFRQEAQAAARMAHPTIVRVFDAGEESTRDRSGHEVQVPFIVMEYVEGRLLKDIVREGPMDPAEAVRITEGVLTALEYSHRAGVVHRDIKPGNVMITHSGQVKVMDFGIARAISDSSATVAQTTTILGTAQYFSPEQARGETVDARSDLYSTGVLLFELLTGRAPFRGDSPVAVAYQHVSEAPVPPSTVAPAVSPALDAVVLRALAKDRFERFQTAADFRTDVHAAGEGRAPERRRPAPEAGSTLFGVDPHSRVGSEAALKELSSDDNDRPQRTQTRPPVAWIWAGIVLVGIVIVAVVFWVVNLQPPEIDNAQTSTIPVVVGSTYDDVAAQLGDLDLTVTRTDEPSDTVDEGRVISTNPEAGTSVLKNSPVAVTVSSGPVQIAMPSVDGQQLDAAWAAITAAGLAQGQQTSDYSPDVPENAVLESTPAAGSEVAEGTTVDLVVSNGKVSVPDVTRQSFEQAVSVLGDQLGLTVKSYVDPGCSGGSVSNQSLPPGDQPQGSEITLGVCSAG